MLLIRQDQSFNLTPLSFADLLDSAIESIPRIGSMQSIEPIRLLVGALLDANHEGACLTACRAYASTLLRTNIVARHDPLVQDTLFLIPR